MIISVFLVEIIFNGVETGYRIKNRGISTIFSALAHIVREVMNNREIFIEDSDVFYNLFDNIRSSKGILRRSVR